MVVVISTEDFKPICPECKSSKLVKFGTKFRKKGMKHGERIRVQQYQCSSCGRITIQPLWG